MVALHRDGRQTDALRAYQRAQAALAEQVGPGAGPRAAPPRAGHPGAGPQPRRPAPWSSAALPAPSSGWWVGTPSAPRSASACDRRALVTVLGPGGVGKTAVALDVAAGNGASLGHGAVVVDLAGAAEGSEVGDVVATTIGVSDGRR